MELLHYLDWPLVLLWWLGVGTGLYQFGRALAATLQEINDRGRARRAVKQSPPDLADDPRFDHAVAPVTPADEVAEIVHNLQAATRRLERGERDIPDLMVRVVHRLADGLTGPEKDRLQAIIVEIRRYDSARLKAVRAAIQGGAPMKRNPEGTFTLARPYDRDSSWMMP